MENLQDYTDWLYNSYVECTISPLGHSEVRAANLAHQALVHHLACNLQGRGNGFNRRMAKERLKTIAQYEKTQQSSLLSYHGKNAEYLRKRDSSLVEYTKGLQSVERISLKGSWTELAALQLVGKIIQNAEQFRTFRMERMDDAHVCGAMKMLLRVLEANGFIMSDDKDQIIAKVE